MLLYRSIYVLMRGRHERSTVGAVNSRLAKIIHWAPRVAAIMIIFFISLFSLDVFGIGASPLEVARRFPMHNSPSSIMIIFPVFAWKRPVVGFVIFLIAGIAFLVFFVRDVYLSVIAFLLVIDAVSHAPQFRAKMLGFKKTATPWRRM